MSTQTKYTPSPWHVKDYSNLEPSAAYIVAKVVLQGGRTQNRMVAELEYDHENREEVLTNATLISFAPEMYEALTAIVDHYEKHYRNPEKFKQYHIAREVVAKMIWKI